MIYKGRIVWKSKFSVLAAYNRDVQRGYVFPPETVERMAKLQREYNEEYMNTETEDRRSTQVSEQRTVNSEQCGSRVFDLKCVRLKHHTGTCSTSPEKAAVVDRSDEFDQTRQHAHIPASLCPVADCKEWPTVPSCNCGTSGDVHGVLCTLVSIMPSPSRQVSPAINEFRIQQLEDDLARKDRLLKAAETDNRKLSHELDLRDKRIRELSDFKSCDCAELIAKNAMLQKQIAGFERMNERLSNAVDEWLANATAEHKAAA